VESVRSRSGRTPQKVADGWKVGQQQTATACRPARSPPICTAAVRAAVLGPGVSHYLARRPAPRSVALPLRRHPGHVSVSTRRRGGFPELRDVPAESQIRLCHPISSTMAKKNSFDITTDVDLQEVDNAVNQAMKEVATRYDFRGTNCALDLDRQAGSILLDADDAYKLKALMQILKERLVRRNVPVENLDEGSVEEGTGGRVRQRVHLKQGIDQETAKRIVKDVKDQGFKKVQVQIQGEELRVTGPKRDDLQEVMAYLRGRDYGMKLQFGNYR